MIIAASLAMASIELCSEWEAFWVNENQCAAHSCWYTLDYFDRPVDWTQLKQLLPNDGKPKRLRDVANVLKSFRVDVTPMANVVDLLRNGPMKPLLLVIKNEKAVPHLVFVPWWNGQVAVVMDGMHGAYQISKTRLLELAAGPGIFVSERRDSGDLVNPSVLLLGSATAISWILVVWAMLRRFLQTNKLNRGCLSAVCVCVMLLPIGCQQAPSVVGNREQQDAGSSVEVTVASDPVPRTTHDQLIDDSCSCAGRVNGSFNTRGVVALKIVNRDERNKRTVQFAASCGCLSVPSKPLVLEPGEVRVENVTMMGDINSESTTTISFLEGREKKLVPLKMPALSEKPFVLSAPTLHLTIPSRLNEIKPQKIELIWKNNHMKPPAVASVNLSDIDTSCPFIWRPASPDQPGKDFVMDLEISAKLLGKLAEKSPRECALIFHMSECADLLRIQIVLDKTAPIVVSPAGLFVQRGDLKGSIKRRVELTFTDGNTPRLPPTFRCASGVSARWIDKTQPFTLEIIIEMNQVKVGQSIAAVQLQLPGQDDVPIPLRVVP